MIKLKAYSTLLVVFFVCNVFLVNAQGRASFGQVISNLAKHQHSSGGFLDHITGQSSPASTAQALLLSSLYGLKEQFNFTDIPKYLASLITPDYGYGLVAGGAADIESIRDVLLSYERVGSKPNNAAGTAKYIKSLFDKSTGLYASRTGGQGSVKATAAALQSLEILNAVDTSVFGDIKTALKRGETVSGLFNFNETGVSEISSNYYALVAGSIVGYDFSAPGKVAQSILSLQTPKGTFFTDSTKTATTVESTADATLSLHVLDRITKGVHKFVDAINHAALRAGLRYIPSDLASAARAHSAIAVTKAFKDGFQISTFPQGADPNSDRIMEGSEFKPAAVIAGKDAGIAHGDFAITANTKFHGSSAPVKTVLKWDKVSQKYIGESTSTAGKFGPAETVYTFTTTIPGLGPISFDINDTRAIGYGIVVVPKASLDVSGKEIREGEAVTTGTDFKFAVSLASKNDDNLLKGDFVVTFSVVDSSDVIIFQKKVEGASNTAPITFTYKLTANDVPAGKLSFRFDVSSASGSKVAHTTRVVTYSLVVPLVATKISFDATPVYKIGDNVKLHFEPATFPDLHNAYALATKDFEAKDAASARKFVLDVKSAQGTLLRSIDATVKDFKYFFQFPVDATFDQLGLNVLSFRYQPASGESIVLQNYDSEINELYEDTHVLNYTVRSDLSLVEVSEKPQTAEFVYGNDVVFKFRVKDTISGQYLHASENTTANVYLELTHNDESGRAYTTVSVPAVSENQKDFTISWNVSPNAHKGVGTMSISAQDADGKKIAIKDTVSLKASIGGNIDFVANTYAADVYDSASGAFVVGFDLLCQNQPLKNAQLRAAVSLEADGSDNVVAILPVAHDGGHYSVSWLVPTKDVKSGTYRVNFFRETDRLHEVEQRDTREKAARKARQLKGESDPITPKLSDTEEFAALGLKPLHTVDISSTAFRNTELPVKAEFIALILFGGIVGWLISKRSNLE